MEHNVTMMAEAARKASRQLAAVSLETRNAALLAIADGIDAHKEEIMQANVLDVAQATEENLSAPLLSRLKVNETKCQRMIDGLRALAELPDPLGHVQYAKELSPGLNLYRVACPIGVVGVIFESRPDALVQISSLCLKSGNAVLLKGGREALRTNIVLTRIINEATEKAGVPAGWCDLLQSREDVSEMLGLHRLIDLIIPRGSNAFVEYIMRNSQIPVLGHAEGLCHVYVDEEIDLQQAVKVAVDSKTQNLSVCNAAETMLVNRKIAAEFLPVLAEELKAKGTEVRGDARVQSLIGCLPASEEDWQTEYLDNIISIKIVDSMDEAIEHINHYGSHHTDSILSASAANAERFMTLVDSADVFWNCSTRFSDGFLFGFGAEVGIATGKIHARGPMGMEGLCTYKYRLYGSGQTLSELNGGQISLTHQDIAKELPQL
ncbi:MAG: glutamate-5-semialdehyde dehydrogenase [Clostridia bacterium]|nr:glutamate-5-semialdehyde dehydrogenase [Clostridia bacterium]